MGTVKATWVIQSSGVQTRHTLQLIKALNELGEPWIDIGINRQEGIITEVPPELGSNLIPYGSCYLIKVAEERKWKHLFFNENFRVDVWLKNRDDMLNQDAQVCTLSAAKQSAITIAYPFWFIRPLHDLKDFAGEVMHYQELINWVTRLEEGDCEINGDLMVALSQPKEIQMEWRYFIVGGKVITGSSYRFKGQPHRKQELDLDVLAEAQAMADKWLPHPTCCMDLALCGGELKVVEFNGLNASGFYDHDVKAFAKSVSEYCYT